jgi:type IV pilus assembly protein PilE
MNVSGSNALQQKGLTLIDVMIVVAIIAILSTIAYPLYSSYLTKTRRADAESDLTQIMQAQQRYFTANSTYVTDLSKVGYASATVTSESNHYTITASACVDDINSCVKLTAVPQRDDAECGNIIYDSTGVKSISGDASNRDKCW